MLKRLAAWWDRLTKQPAPAPAEASRRVVGTPARKTVARRRR